MEPESLQDEIAEAAYKGAKAAQEPVEFPDVQRVEVINQSDEANLSTIENTLKSLLNALEKKDLQVDTKALESRLELILKALSKEVEDNQVDYSDILSAIKESIPESFDYDEYFERLDDRLDKLDLSDAIKEGFKSFTSSNWLPVVDAIEKQNAVSVLNSSTTALDNGEAYTGTWEDVTKYPSIKIAVKTDQDGYYEIQWSPDGTNVDSTLTRYYRTAQIEPPHKFENMRRYVRVIFYNNSGTNQTYFRLQTILSNSASLLNIPLDGTMSQDYDSISTRPSDFNTEVSLGRRQGYSLWNKFGYNQDIDIGTEVVASFGGTFDPITTETTLTIVSDSTDDDGDPAGTGCNSIVVYGIDANEDEVIEVVTLNGTTNVVTTSEWLGINRVAMFLCGSGKTNAGNITITATTGGSTLAQMVAGGGVTQQCIFYVPRKHQFIAEWLRVNTLKVTGQGNQNPIVTVKLWVFSRISNGKQEVYKVDIDTAITNDVSENPLLPFPISERTVVWLEATTDKDDTTVNARFSGILVNDVDL